MFQKKDRSKKEDARNYNRWAKIVIIGSLALLIIDFIYSQYMGINYTTRDRCVIYSFLPRWAFLIYEYLFELFIVVLMGVFVGILLEEHANKLKRFFPKNQALAFLYASIIPVCSCGVIPVIETMKQRVSLKVIITFVIAAPLLNPFIIIMSVTVLGLKYALLRIISSFILAIGVGILVELASKLLKENIVGKYNACDNGCNFFYGDVFGKTLKMTIKLAPYIVVAGATALLFEVFNPKQALDGFSFSNQWLSYGLMELIGIPVYICNGADILFLKPMLSFTDLSMGAAMIFSMTSSAICISSIVMLAKFIGKKLTAVLIGSVLLITMMLGFFIDLFL